MIDFKTKFDEKEFIVFLKKQGIIVKTNTKARGNLGICFENRIDVSKNADQVKRIQILAHEYGHKVHIDIEKEAFQKGGTLERLFNTECVSNIKHELLTVTHFVDPNSLFVEFHSKKLSYKKKLQVLEEVIKQAYPDFKRSYEFSPIKSYFRKNKSHAKYFLQYDQIRIVNPLTRKENLYCISNLDSDFADIPEPLKAYIRLKNVERKYKRLLRVQNKAEKYYFRPTELFARFIEGLFLDSTKIKELAPQAFSTFVHLLEAGYYGKLRELVYLAGLGIL